MSIDVDFTFAHSFALEVLEELPGEVRSPRLFFPGRRADTDGINLRVTPHDGAAWIGTFAFGNFGSAGTSRVLTMPDPERLCIVARGAGFIVSADSPESWETVNA